MEYVIIVAGGSGSRMGSEIPKQFLEIAGLPILMHTIWQFHRYSAQLQIILVLPASQIESWTQLQAKHHFEIAVTVVEGGQTRFQSVRNGLLAINDTAGEVAIHDGVRPFVPIEVIGKSFQVAREKGNAVTAVALKDSLRQMMPQGSTQSADRSRFRLIQTPQTFRISLLKEAFLQPERETFTDDATVVEAAGHVIHLIDGDYQNIKITTQDDLRWADFFAKSMVQAMR